MLSDYFVLILLNHTTLYWRKNVPVIEFYVEEFLTVNETITADDLSLLEREITNAINAKNEGDMKSSLNRFEPDKQEPESSQVVML